MTYFANFDYPCGPLGKILNIDVHADQEQILRLLIFNRDTGDIVHESDIPRTCRIQIRNHADYLIDEQRKDSDISVDKITEKP